MVDGFKHLLDSIRALGCPLEFYTIWWMQVCASAFAFEHEFRQQIDGRITCDL